METDTKRFNRYCKGRCPDKFMAMKNLCGLDKVQYNVLVDKWCSKLTRFEIAEKNALSLRTLDRTYAESKIKILARIWRIFGKNMADNIILSPPSFNHELPILQFLFSATTAGANQGQRH